MGEGMDEYPAKNKRYQQWAHFEDCWRQKLMHWNTIPIVGKNTWTLKFFCSITKTYGFVPCCRKTHSRIDFHKECILEGVNPNSETSSEQVLLKSSATWVQCCPSRVLTDNRGFLCIKLLNPHLPDKCSSKKHWLTVRKNVTLLCALALES